MFTKKDYIEYFRQISTVERSMVYRLHGFISVVTDETLIYTLHKVLEDELRHYASALSVLEDILLEDDAEKRKFKRATLFGEMHMTSLSNAAKNEARCVDISEDGLRFESDSPLRVGDRFDIHLTSYGRTGIARRLGKIMWLDEIKIKFFSGDTKRLYLGGMLFEK